MQLFKRGSLTRCVSLLLSEYNYLERSTTYDNADLASNEISSPLLLADGAAAPAPSSQEAITLDTLGPTPHPCPSPPPPPAPWTATPTTRRSNPTCHLRPPPGRMTLIPTTTTPTSPAARSPWSDFEETLLISFFFTRFFNKPC